MAINLTGKDKIKIKNDLVIDGNVVLNGNVEGLASAHIYQINHEILDGDENYIGVIRLRFVSNKVLTNHNLTSNDLNYIVCAELLRLSGSDLQYENHSTMFNIEDTDVAFTCLKYSNDESAVVGTADYSFTLEEINAMDLTEII